MFWEYKYLGPDILEGFDHYVYSCKDTSPLSNYVMHPFWNQVVKLCPRWVAPNLLTFVGFCFCVAHFLLLTGFDYDYTANQKGSDHPIPSVVWVFVAIFLFLAHTLDGIDGKQARRTGTSGPLGELFDHGLDSWSTVFIAGSVYSTFGRNGDGYSVPVMHMYLILWNVFLSFHISHWEKYLTGVMYLPWGYDMAMVGGTGLYLATAIGGYEMWKHHFPGGISAGTVVEVTLYLGSIGLALPTALRNVYRSYRDRTGKMRTFVEAIRPLVSLFVGFALALVWVLCSKNDILKLDLRCFFYACGTLYANMSCRLIVAQMSSTRSELFTPLLLPLGLAAAAATLLPIGPKQELAILYSVSALITAAHAHYGVCVVRQMCSHLKIECFRIKNCGEQRLLDTPLDAV